VVKKMPMSRREFVKVASASIALSGTTFAQHEAMKLFNGKDLAGFYTFLRSKGKNNDPDKVFTVQDGAIRVSGQEFGYFCTEQEFENYHLTVEFKWGAETHAPRKDRARDSGILYHFPSTAPDRVWPTSIECQIIEGGTGDIILVGSASMANEERLKPYFAGVKLSDDGKRIISGRVNWYGRSPEWKDVVNFRGKDDLEKLVGEWNVVEVIADGDNFTHIVNGKEAARGMGAEPRKGKILFQSEGAEIFYRKIELKPLKG
jgi:hypothetical protein